MVFACQISVLWASECGMMKWNLPSFTFVLGEYDTRMSLGVVKGDRHRVKNILDISIADSSSSSNVYR